MDSIIELLGMTATALLVPVAVVILVAIVLGAVIRVAKENYIKVPPNMVAVISGRNHRVQTPEGTVTVGYKLVRGGAVLVWPFFERKDELSLTVITIPDLVVKDAITKEGVALTVKAVANLKIGSEDTLLMNAVERLLGKSEEEIRKLAYETLEGHLRSMLGQLTVEQINSARALFAQTMISESQGDLSRLGLRIDILTIKELADDSGYLRAMGLQRTAEIKRDAVIGSAKADRQAVIESTTAKQEGEVRKQANLAIEAEAEKERNVKVAQFLAATNAESARAAQAGPLATAEAKIAVVEKEQEVELMRTRKATDVQRAEQERREQELIATVVKPAEAARRTVIIDAEAKRQAAILVAEAEKAAAILEAEGRAKAVEMAAAAERLRLEAEGTGRAEATRVHLEAEAAGNRAKLLAEADGIKARGLAEAEAIDQKAASMKKLDESGRLLQILEAAQTLGPALVKEFAGVMAAATAPLGEADKIVMVDSGGSNGHGGAMERMANVGPQAIFGLLQRLGAMGVDVSALLGKAGIKETPDTTGGRDDLS